MFSPSLGSEYTDNFLIYRITHLKINWTNLIIFIYPYPMNPQNIAVYNICSVLFSGSKAAVILQEELLHKNLLQDVKKLIRPSYCQPGDFFSLVNHFETKHTSFDKAYIWLHFMLFQNYIQLIYIRQIFFYISFRSTIFL